MQFIKKLSNYKLEYNFFIYLFGKSVSAGVILLSIPLFLKLFGEKEYGAYVYFSTTVLMIGSLTNGWIIQGVLRFLKVRNTYNTLNEIFNFCFFSSVFSALIMTVLLLKNEESLFTLTLGVFCVIFYGFYVVELSMSQSLLESKKFVISEIIRSLTFFIVPILLYFLSLFENKYAIILGLCSSYMVSFIYLNKFKFYRVRLSIFRKSKWSKIYLSYGIPLSIWMVLSPTTNGLDRLIIEDRLGLVELAKYAAIFEIIFKVFSSISVPFNNTLQPLLIDSYYKRDFKEYKKLMNKVILYLTLAFIVFISILVVLKDFILCNYLSFCDDQNLFKLLLILASSSYIWQIAIILQKNIELANKTWVLSVLILIISFISSIVNFLFVKENGIILVSCVSLITASIYLLFILKISNKILK